MAINSLQAIINGETISLTLNNSTGKYEATVTAPSKSSYKKTGHYYPVTVIATDMAGNTTTVDSSDSTLGTNLRLKVIEKIAPSISIIAPTDSQLMTNNKPTITWIVIDDDSGVDANTIGITIDNGTKITSGITKTETTNGYSCSYTPESALSDGSHTIKFDASDNDGNAATQKSVSFKVDTVPPTLNVTAPAEEFITNSSSCRVSGTTNDVTSSPVTVTVNGSSVTVNSDGTFSTTINLAEGENTITVVATDYAGKSTTVNRKVILDTVPPIIKGITITPNPVDAGKTYIISIEVED